LTGPLAHRDTATGTFFGRLWAIVFGEEWEKKIGLGLSVQTSATLKIIINSTFLDLRTCIKNEFPNFT
jgi:hypothetical protein